ncbi:uncharacterized protein LOC123004269 [Tribolium madens]|uniref:uncharacterized protein LOC123004269 n=1 Tax=Tribolium madens TaxID=41895 RepID=UPI001CF75B13|nr:uncharacterized protein LOC123004269 [Tribolium madens]
MAKIFNAIIVAIFVCCFKYSDGSVCISEEGQCLCRINENSRIDLNQIWENSLVDSDSSGNSFYFWGCRDGTQNITFNGTVKSVTGSLIWANASVAKPLGFKKEIRFHLLDEKEKFYEIVYKEGQNVKASIHLVCTPEDTFIKILNANSTNPQLALGSPHACVITEKTGLSTGSVLLLICFISFGIYFIGGMLILYFMRGARGLETIPNIDFWRSLPGLVKDGVIFLFSGCSASSITTPETYDRI